MARTVISPVGERHERYRGFYWNAGDEYQVGRVGNSEALLEIVFACPLGKAVDQIHTLSADLPTFVLDLCDGAHGPAAEDAPVAFRNIGYPHHLPIDQSRDRADADGLPYIEDVAT